MSRTFVLGPRRLAAVALAFVLSAFTAAAGPVDSVGAKQAKNEDVEKASAALQKMQVDEAYKLLQEAVKKNPQLPPARLILAQMMSNYRELQQQARGVLELAASENPDHPAIYLTSGKLALSEGRVTDAILNCNTALNLSAADRWTKDQKQSYLAEARAGLAAAGEARRDWALARTHLNVLLELEPKNGNNRWRLGRALFFLDKVDDAHAELQKAVKDDPNLEPPAVTMGRLYTTKGDFKKAREWLDKAIASDPKNVKVHLAYADWLLTQNEVEQARIHAEQAEKLDGANLDVQKLKGLVARVRKDYATAEKIFRQINTNAPGDFFAANQLALVMADQADGEQKKRALQLAQITANSNQRSADALASAGYVCFRNGLVDEAQKLLQAAASGGQVSSDTAYFLALVLNERGKFEDVKSVLEGALKANGLFVYRTDAQKLLDQAKAKLPKDAKPKTP